MEDEKEGAGKIFKGSREWATFNTLALHKKIVSGKDYWASQLC